MEFSAKLNIGFLLFFCLFLFEKALTHHRSGGLIVTSLAKLDQIIGVFQEIFLSADNQMITANYVVPLGITYLLTNFAGTFLIHFIPSVSTARSTWPGPRRRHPSPIHLVELN